MIKLSTIAAAAVLLLALPANTYAESKLTVIGDPIAAPNQAMDINNNGTAVINADYEVVQNGDCVNYCYKTEIYTSKNGALTKVDSTESPDSIRQAIAINDSDVIIGNSQVFYGATQGFVIENGKITNIQHPENGMTRVSDINNDGVVVGNTDCGKCQTKAFSYKDGVVTTLPTPDPNTGNSYASAINDKGQIFGILDSGKVYKLVIWESGQVKELAVFGSSYAAVTGANESGDVIGTVSSYDTMTNMWTNRAFLYTGGQLTYLNALNNETTETYAVDINDAGIIVGTSNTGPTTTGEMVTWDKEKNISRVTLGDGPEYFGNPLSISDLGVVAGGIGGSSASTKAFIYSVTLTDTINPELSITAPMASDKLKQKQTLTVTADARDNVGVEKVVFSMNGNVMCTDLTAPYSCTTETPKNKVGTITIYAEAFDIAGNSITKTSTLRS